MFVEFLESNGLLQLGHKCGVVRNSQHLFCMGRTQLIYWIDLYETARLLVETQRKLALGGESPLLRKVVSVDVRLWWPRGFSNIPLNPTRR